MAQIELTQFDQELVFLGAETCVEGDNLGFELGSIRVLIMRVGVVMADPFPGEVTATQ